MSRVYLIPVLVFLLFQTTFIGTYIAAILQGHVVPAVPYISDAATYSPESCVFGQLVNMGSVLLGISIYIRFRHILKLCILHVELGDTILKYNKISLYFGVLSCLGISIVANFQETNVRIVHFIGAFCCFGFGTLYFWMQAFLSYMIQPYSGTKFKAHLRIIMSAFSTIFFIVLSITGVISHIKFNGDNPRKWYPSDGGWYYHITSTISEWIVATIFCFYILTFTSEFKDISIAHPEITLAQYTVSIVACIDL